MTTLLAAPGAAAQPSRPPTVELSLLLWRPAASLRLSSDARGIPGSLVDLQSDLGAGNRNIPIIGVVVHPGARHRFRFEYLPIDYDASTVLAHDIVFSGAVYRRGERGNSSRARTAINVGYEDDFLARKVVTLGAVFEVKGTVVQEELASASADESRRTSVPAPALGAAVHVTPTPRLTVDGQFRGFVIPDSQSGHYGGRYVDVDAGATFLLVRHLGARAGLRWLNIRHLGEADTARMSLPGAYVGLVVATR